MAGLANLLLGYVGVETMQDRTLRLIIDFDLFVGIAGVRYFFLPSIPALRYLAAL
jgi:hypothetical protein